MNSASTQDNRPLACITGATSGIGRSYATAFASAGYDLLVTGRREAILRELGTELGNRHGIEVSVFVGDLADPAVTGELSTLIARRKRLRVLIHNAGFGHRTRFFDTPSADLRAMGEVHMQCAVELVRSAVPVIRSETETGTEDGRLVPPDQHPVPPAVVLVSSLAAFLPLPAAAMYTATKGFLLAFGRALAPQLQREGIAVQVLCPGFTHTEFHDRLDWSAEQRRDRGIVRWMSADEVVRRSLRHLGRGGRRPGGNPVFIPGFTNRLIRALTRITPPVVYRWIASRAAIDEL